jgi:hypothetical protein
MQTSLQRLPRFWLVIVCALSGCAISAMSEDDPVDELAYVGDAGAASVGASFDAAASQRLVTDAAQSQVSTAVDAALNFPVDAAAGSVQDASSAADAALAPRDASVADAGRAPDASTIADASTSSDAGSKDAGVKDAGSANMCVAASCSCGLLKPCCNASNQCACQDLLGLCILPAL